MTEAEEMDLLDGILRCSKNLRYSERGSKLWYLAKKRLIEQVGKLEPD